MDLKYKRFLQICLVTVSLAVTSMVQAQSRGLPDFVELAEKQSPSVVNISTVQNSRAKSNNGTPMDPSDPAYEIFRRFFPQVPGNGQPQQENRSLGSGFIISPDGYVMTNAHVIDGADEVTVKLLDKREFRAKVIGADKRTDVALLKIDASGLPAVKLGDSAALKPGEWVVAIGSPFGFEHSVTAGIVSAKGRALPQENFVPFIQTDVAINPGNSGGPLFNLKGEVVGINSQIYSRSGGSMGLSFSIPIDVAIDISNQLKAGGKIARGWLGIAIQEISKELADSFGMKNTNGALIAGVEKGGPADKSGLEAGDIILKFDGKAIAASSDLPRVVAAVKPGKTVSAEVLRKGATKTLSITVGEAPADKEEVANPNKGLNKPEINRIGLLLRDLTPQQKKKLNGKGGLMVMDVQGLAAQAGIRRGDVVLGLNNTEVQSLEQFNKQLAGIPSGKTVAVLIQRGDNTLYVPIKVSDAK